MTVARLSARAVASTRNGTDTTAWRVIEIEKLHSAGPDLSA